MNYTSETETFNEANVQRDFKNVMECAQRVREALRKGDTDIQDSIGNSSLNDAMSGSNAIEIKRQWEDLAHKFESFLQNFQNWYDQSIAVSRANQAFQASSSKVQMDI